MELLKVREENGEIFSSSESTPAFLALITDFTGRGITKFYCLSMADWTADSFSPKAVYFFIERLYQRV